MSSSLTVCYNEDGFFDSIVRAFRLNVLQQHTSTAEDDISNRLAVLQVFLDGFNFFC